MPDADCRCTPRRPWSLGRGGQTPSPIKFIIRTKSSGKTLTRILADLDPNPPPLAPLALPLCSPDLRSYLRGGILGGRQRGRGRKEPGPGGRAREGRKEGVKAVNYAIRSTHWTGKWRLPRSGRPPSARSGLDTFASDTLAKQILPDIRSSRGRLRQLPNERSIGISNQRNARTLVVAVVLY